MSAPTMPLNYIGVSELLTLAIGQPGTAIGSRIIEKKIRKINAEEIAGADLKCFPIYERRGAIPEPIADRVHPPIQYFYCNFNLGDLTGSIQMRQSGNQ